jgi:hypothetical protein
MAVTVKTTVLWLTPSSLVYRYQHFRRTCTYSFSVAPTLMLETADFSGTLVPIHQITWIISLPYACPTLPIYFIYLFTFQLIQKV